MKQLELQLYTDEVDVNGRYDRQYDGINRPAMIRYLGKARKQNNGLWTCLADVNGALCVVEVKITEQETP